MVHIHSIFKGSLIALIFSWVAGCALNPLKPVKNPTAAWAQNKVKLEALTCFTASGLAGYSDGQTGQSANLIWRQAHLNQYVVGLSGPIGIDASTLRVNHNHASFQSGQKVYTAHSPERLLQEVLGWQMPVSGLQFWIKGLGQNPSKLELNAFGYIRNMVDQGWQIQYLNYENVDGTGLPTQAIFRRKNLRVVLSIDKWQKSC